MKKQHTTLQHLLTFAASLLLIILTAAVTAACSGNGAPYGYEIGEDITPTLTVSPATLNAFKAAGETRTLTVSSNVEWTVTMQTADASWLSVVKTGTTAVTVTVAANETIAQRTAQFTVSTTVGTPIEKTYTVTQEGKAIEFTVTPETLNVFEADGGTQTLTIKSDVEWQVTVQTADASWLNVTTDGNIINVNVAANETTEERTAQFTVSTTGDNPIVCSYTVTQKGKEIPPTTLTLDKNDVQIAYEGTAADPIQVTANAPWSVLPGYADWLTVTVTETTITLTATPNDLYEQRTTELIVRTNDEAAEQKVTVTQAAKPKVVPGEDDNNTPGYSRRSK